MNKIRPRHILQRIGVFLDSKYFLGLVLGLFIIQAAWIAWSFIYPMAYDENYHYPIIKIFSTQLSPFIINQPSEYDYLRDLGNETSLLYHYLLSYPFRALQLVNGNQEFLVICLRFINILFVAIGLLGYRRLLRKVGIPKRYIHVGLLLFATLPIVSFLAATINYDNMLFAVVPFFLIYAVRIINDRTALRFYDLCSFAILGLFASLVKYTFLPMFVAVTIVVVGWMIYHHRRALFEKIGSAIKKAAKLKIKFALAMSALLVLFALFSAIYVKNTVQYGTPSPYCTKTMSLERCMKSNIVVRNENAYATKSQRVGERLPDYTMNWIGSMWRGMTALILAGSTGFVVAFSPPIYYAAVFYAFVIMVAAIMYGVGKGLFRSRARVLLLLACVTVIAAVYLFNVSGYYKSYMAFANQPRYLLTAMPILITFGVYALAVSFGRLRFIRYGILVATLAILTIGGGIASGVLASDATWYRQNETVQKVNKELRRAFQMIVIDRHEN